ncbi:MAG: ATP synthase F0 subunit B [Erysipelotrichaceae bacterium]|nr:ATP synthase F0 subunit B [Erysipelotrichaceae bacterium]
MSINLDIQGALFPNIFTILVQLAATLVLFFAAKKLLFKPARNMLAKRAEVMQSSLDEAKNARIIAETNLNNAKEELKNAKAASERIIISARTEAQQLRDEMVKKAENDAQAKIDEADRRILQHQKEIEKEIREEMVNVAMTAVAKLLDEKATSADDNAAIDRFVKEVSDKS